MLSALDEPLSPEETAALEHLIPKVAFQGSRYPEAQMATLDSER